MVKESPPEDNSTNEDPGVSEGAQLIHLGIWTSASMQVIWKSPFVSHSNTPWRDQGKLCFPSEMDVMKPAAADAPLRLLLCSFYQDVRTLLILSSLWLCIPLTPSALKWKKWRKLWDRNEASSKGKAATSAACISAKLRGVNFKGTEASFLQQLDEASLTHIGTDMVFLTPELRKHLSCIQRLGSQKWFPLDFILVPKSFNQTWSLARICFVNRNQQRTVELVYLKKILK